MTTAKALSAKSVARLSGALAISIGDWALNVDALGCQQRPWSDHAIRQGQLPAMENKITELMNLLLCLTRC